MKKILEFKEIRRKTMKGKMIKVVCAFVLCLLLLTVSPAYADVPGELQDAEAMWIEPSTKDLTTDTVSVGDRFNVTVWIHLTELCAAWEFKIAYNKTYLNATGCDYTAGSKSQFFENLSATIPVTPILGLLNATHNYVLHAESGLFPPFRNPGYGSLAWIEFEVVAVPESERTIVLKCIDVYPDGTETYAKDPDFEYISFTDFECIVIIPEFLRLLIPVMLMSLTLVAIIFSTKLRSSKSNQMKTKK